MAEESAKRTVLAVLDDLFFRVKIEAASRQEGLAVDFVQTEKDALSKAAEHPPLILLDLNCLSVQPLVLIAALKSNETTKEIILLGYVSHVQEELRRKAQEAGCDLVMARSAFSQNLPRILKQHAVIP
ncbi:MAG: response regulator [Bryobacteraceae bacterium]